MSHTTCCSLLFLVFLCRASLGAEFTDVPPLQVGERVDMAVDSGGRVFLAAGTRLLRLDGDLNLSEDVAASTILQIALSNDGNNLVVCFSDESCAVHDSGNFSAGELLSVEQASASPDNLALFTSPDDTFYIGSEGSIPGSSGVVYLTQYGFGASPFVRSSGNDFPVQTSGFSRLFGGGFTHGMYAYYIVIDDSNNDLAVRAVRVCDVDNCVSQCDFAALYEAEIPCGTLSAGQTICGVSLVESFLGSPGPTLVYSVCGPRNHICSVPLASIDDEFLSTYSTCSTQDGTQTIKIVWDQTGGALPTCFFFPGVSTMCDYDQPLNNFEDISTTVLYNTVDGVTATLAITIEETVTLLYVGYTNGAEHFLAALQVQDTDEVTNFDGAFTTMEISSPVTELHWRDGLEYVYAASADSVFQVPLEQCSQLTDCQSCTASPNPLCGWCTVEQKCSRRSQCQNSNKTMRWVEDDAQCISSVITPTQFVLGIGQNVNVTVTPSLPPPLSTEVYLCLFKQTGGSLEFTTSATTEDNMMYTCNVNGTVPSFDGVRLRIDFSFTSSLVNISFGTEEQALTFFDCPAVMSCSECVETDNACGWCIYNKLCRGTADDCTNSNETYWLRLDGADSSDEVCPLLLPPATPTGDYIQPERIDRDLELVTRNLPEPPSADFRYECNLMTSPELHLPAVYNNESSITCRVDSSQVVLSPGETGQEAVQTLVEWVRDSDSLRHPIDTLGGAQIKTLLYDCEDLGNICSVCLAANTLTGFDCAWCSDGSNCNVGDECPGSPSTTFTNCPAPTITSISPDSGPPTGGTVITIGGTDLGVTYSDVDGRVFLGVDIQCMTLEDLSEPGVQIGCETPNLGFLETPATLSVMVVLESGTASGPGFSVETPSITAVNPQFGPVSGGVLVNVTGSSLAIGNVDNTRVTFNGTDCFTEDVSDDVILCRSGAYTGDSLLCNVTLTGSATCPERNFSLSVPVVVYVDGSAFPENSSILFEYRCNPIIVSVSPTKTIPAGGVTLLFTGCDTDVVQRPELVVTSGTSTRQVRATSTSTECISTSNTTVNCVMPSLDSADEGISLTYSLMFGNVAVGGTGDLAVTVQPNPNFADDALRTTDIAKEDNPLLEIEGENLDSVEVDEYVVTVGGEMCTQPRVTTISNGGQGILCNAPSSAPSGITDAQVVVFVGQNLNYSVGTVSYSSTGSTNGSGDNVTIVIDGEGSSGSGDNVTIVIDGEGSSGSDNTVAIAVGVTVPFVIIAGAVALVAVLLFALRLKHGNSSYSESKRVEGMELEAPLSLTDRHANKLPEQLPIRKNPAV